jgi:hypothetical protein
MSMKTESSASWPMRSNGKTGAWRRVACCDRRFLYHLLATRGERELLAEIKDEAGPDVRSVEARRTKVRTDPPRIQRNGQGG